MSFFAFDASSRLGNRIPNMGYDMDENGHDRSLWSCCTMSLWQPLRYAGITLEKGLHGTLKMIPKPANHRFVNGKRFHIQTLTLDKSACRSSANFRADKIGRPFTASCLPNNARLARYPKPSNLRNQILILLLRALLELLLLLFNINSSSFLLFSSCSSFHNSLTCLLLASPFQTC